MKRILCYGDSNTWGYISGTDHQRYNENQRWTKLLQKQLGNDYEIIEEGLNSRTLFSEDERPGKEGRNGFTYLKPCLDSHDKIDIIILMLGTNELKFKFNKTPEDIVNMLDRYVKFIKNFKSQIDKSTPKLIICGIPPVKESQSSDLNKKYDDAPEKSHKVNELYEKYCKENNLIFVNNNDLQAGIDCVHLTLESHKKLSERLAKILMEEV